MQVDVFLNENVMFGVVYASTRLGIVQTTDGIKHRGRVDMRLHSPSHIVIDGVAVNEVPQAAKSVHQQQAEAALSS